MTADAALEAGDAPAAAGKAVRAGRWRIYEAVVRRYPTSGYCDNALWQAASLARRVRAVRPAATIATAALKLLPRG